MKKAVYGRLILLTAVAIIMCSLISAVTYAIHTENQTKEWLTKLTLSTAENYKHTTDATALSQAAGGSRITLIAPSGQIIADSAVNASEMENHAVREEVKYAASDSVSIAMRASATLGQKFMYAAIKTDDGTILRLAHSYNGHLHNLAAQLPALLAAIVMTLILSAFLARRFTRSVTAPLENMVEALSAHEYDNLAHHPPPYYEMDKMMQTLRDLLHTITESNTKLQSERAKVDYILSNMAEGFVLMDSQKNILLCNNSARRFFSCSKDLILENIYHLTRHPAVINALTAALENGLSTAFDLELQDGLIANVSAAPSPTAENERGVTLLIVDRTPEKQLEQQKRDFFSNASHELKTPITSILGFSEMLSQGLVISGHERDAVVGRIETEAKRLSALINGILTVSKLESHTSALEDTDFNLRDVIGEAVAALSPVKEDTAIDITTDLADVPYRADKGQIYALCVNLIENAVKYNKPGGKVEISLKAENDHALLTVKDTGIGIPPEYQARVFERFFRVDDGRDKKIGGTGLGLSIVKHIAGIYGGKIALQSQPDHGTTVEVALPVTFQQI